MRLIFSCNCMPFPPKKRVIIILPAVVPTLMKTREELIIQLMIHGFGVFLLMPC